MSVLFRFHFFTNTKQHKSMSHSQAKVHPGRDALIDYLEKCFLFIVVVCVSISVRYVRVLKFYKIFLSLLFSFFYNFLPWLWCVFSFFHFERWLNINEDNLCRKKIYIKRRLFSNFFFCLFPLSLHIIYKYFIAYPTYLVF